MRADLISIPSRAYGVYPDPRPSNLIIMKFKASVEILKNFIADIGVANPGCSCAVKQFGHCGRFLIILGDVLCRCAHASISVPPTVKCSSDSDMGRSNFSGGIDGRPFRENVSLNFGHRSRTAGHLPHALQRKTQRNSFL